MDTLCKRVEALAPSVICSVLSVNRQQQLLSYREPEYCRSTTPKPSMGCSSAPWSGSCGTAAFRGEPVEVTDIATDPLWAGL